MKAFLSIVIFALGAATLAQVPQAPRAATRTLRSHLGFSYGIPTDWDVVDYSAEAKEEARQNAATEADKKGLGCAVMGLQAKHGAPTSMIVEVALPFDCFGQVMQAGDLPQFAAGASAALQQNFDVGEPVLGTYTRGTHSFWIERATATLKGQPGAAYSIEIACTVGKKAAVCWMTMAADNAALAVFERGMVSVDGDTPEALVPETAFDKKPS
ncbi:MAG TPA: hypothetical protein VG267_15265 [Terracidiphilus sp.]|jgi:hypothetical protein|nr:hypothetical protein [Terracidiphilus sp.]